MIVGLKYDEKYLNLAYECSVWRFPKNVTQIYSKIQNIFQRINVSFYIHKHLKESFLNNTEYYYLTI